MKVIISWYALALGFIVSFAALSFAVVVAVMCAYHLTDIWFK